MPKICGVYRIVNTTTGKCYIGKSENILPRWARHLRELRKGTHHSAKLQRSYDKHGEEVFRLEVVLECPKEALLEEEDNAIKAHDAYHSGYNGTPKAGRDATGVKRTEEFKAKCSEGMKGIVRSTEFKETCRQRQIGVIPTAETRGKLSSALKGKTPTLGMHHTEETKRRMSEAHKGHEVSETTRKKISDKHKGKTRGPMSAEQREAIRAGILGHMKEKGLTQLSPGWEVGRKHTEESKRKMSEAQKGKVIPQESRDKMSAAKKGRPGHSMSDEAKAKIKQARIDYWAKKKKE